MRELKISIRALLFFSLLTGIIYPISMTLISKIIFPYTSQGSLVFSKGELTGSKLIGQKFSDNKYFWGRPSAVNYDPASSGASNQSLASQDLLKAVKEREAQDAIREMRFASASGLDPHISPEAALAQIPRISQARKMKAEQLNALVIKEIEPRQWGLLGEPRVNVLSINILLDELTDERP